MAKKPKYFLEYVFNGEFSVKIDPEGRETLMADLGRNMVCLALEYTVDGLSYSTSAYPDYLEGGGLNFDKASDDELRVSIKGSWLSALNPKWEQLTIDTFQPLGAQKVYSNRISDSNSTSHYINGSDDLFEVGTVSLLIK
jgi:hypothetical protein